MTFDSERFETYCRRKEAAACASKLAGFRTVQGCASCDGLLQIGNGWTRGLFDGPFYVRQPDTPGLPALSLVFVQSRDGNTVADDPSTLGGGETDMHLIYEGLSRVAADAVLAGASTARGEETVFSVWHPELVALRRECGKARHPVQVVLTNTGDLPIEHGLMFTTPALQVVVIAGTAAINGLRVRLGDRPWVEVIDGGQPVSMAAAMHQLYDRGHGVVSAIGGPRTATSLIREGLVRDLYLTTSPIAGGEAGTPFYRGDPRQLERMIEKTGRGPESGVRFEHFRIA
jgi:riboflavin biosynthesis pyrimidine reductase